MTSAADRFHDRLKLTVDYGAGDADVKGPARPPALAVRSYPLVTPPLRPIEPSPPAASRAATAVSASEVAGRATGARATAGVSPSQFATSRTLAAMVRWRPGSVDEGPAFASASAISTVAFQVRNS